MCPCDKLPPQFTFKLPIVWEVLRRQAYRFYRDDIVNGTIIFRNKIVKGSYCFEEECAEETFSHLITRKDKQSGERLPDFDRIRKLTWIRPLIILNCGCSDYKVWSKYCEKSKKDRWYIWCTQEDYVIILEEQKNYYILVTAYIVDKEYTRKQFLRAYSNYKEDNEGIVL